MKKSNVLLAAISAFLVVLVAGIVSAANPLTDALSTLANGIIDFFIYFKVSEYQAF